MKLKLILLPTSSALAAVLVLSGCGKSSDYSDTAAATNQTTAQDMKQQVQQAAADAKDSLSQTKDEFVAATDRKLRELDAEMDDLGKKAGDYKDDARVQADKALVDLRQQRDALGKKYDALKQASQNGWDKTKAGFQSALDDLQKSYDDAKAKFK